VTDEFRYRENAVAADRSEVYDYDMLDRLSTFDRNTLNAEKSAIQGTPARPGRTATRQGGIKP
jgi:hypothetical protein